MTAMLKLTNTEILDLESFIDSRGLPVLISAIAEICREKSEHIATHWQDAALASLWDARADIVYNCREQIILKPVA